jgi:hypothetical protein
MNTKRRQPFYSTIKEDYHDNPKCPAGREILQKHLINDSDAGRPLCKICKRLNDEDDGIIPTSS